MRLYDYLKREKLTYEEMARHLSCTKTTLYRIARGMQYPKVELAKLIRDFTGGEVSLDDIYMDRQNKPFCPCCGHKLGKKGLKTLIEHARR